MGNFIRSIKFGLPKKHYNGAYIYSSHNQNDFMLITCGTSYHLKKSQRKEFEKWLGSQQQQKIIGRPTNILRDEEEYIVAKS